MSSTHACHDSSMHACCTARVLNYIYMGLGSLALWPWLLLSASAARRCRCAATRSLLGGPSSPNRLTSGRHEVMAYIVMAQSVNFRPPQTSMPIPLRSEWHLGFFLLSLLGLFIIHRFLSGHIRLYDLATKAIRECKTKNIQHMPKLPPTTPTTRAKMALCYIFFFFGRG